MPRCINCHWFLKCPATFHVAKEKEERVEVGIVLCEDDDQDVHATQDPPGVPLVPMEKGGKCKRKYGSKVVVTQT